MSKKYLMLSGGGSLIPYIVSSLEDLACIVQGNPPT